MGTYYNPVAPRVTAGFFMKPEGTIRVGTEPLFGSLETTSFAYTTYSAPIGLKPGKSFELGQVNDLSWSHSPEFEPVEGFNVGADMVYQLTGEETTVTVEVYEFNPQILELAVGTGNRYTLGAEQLITFGGGCRMRNRPISIEFVNISCDVPNSPDTQQGITGGVLTIYDAFIQNGIEWSMSARELNTASFEFKARPVMTMQMGNRLGNLYLY